ncbi:flagellar export chaperone FliS [Thiomicrospira sp. XS5]|uniref:flagellar export chaperone FliS n=1 Tax=Thiomicrospira sp. XS5 TaxID=1775636 RepID=UPI000B01755F|nr:flagellar export chaperone FliS [Thiomicrospira sp. XS5]
MMNPMMKQKFLDQYQQTSVQTGLEDATPHKLVAMLYDGILDNLALAKGAMERKDFELKANKLNKAIMIIGSLRSNLDMENGGEVATNYEALYSYMNRRLLEASSQNQVETLDEVADLARELKDAWNQMPSNFKMASQSQIEMVKKAK